MSDKYEGRRITINYLALTELCKVEGIPDNAPNSVIAASVEKMIFQGNVEGCGCTLGKKKRIKIIDTAHPKA